jgi:hypothetical protein
LSIRTGGAGGFLSSARKVDHAGHVP